MANENEVEITDEDIKEEEFASEVLESDETDWKAEAQKLKGIAKRRATKLAKLKATPKPAPQVEEKKEEKKTDELDYGQLAYLEAKQITTDDEIDFIKGVLKRTGESLKDVLKDEYVLNKLKSLKDAKAVLEATPSGTKGGALSIAKDTVEYWIAKGEMPPADKPELRQKYVNARIAQEKGGAKFYNS